VKRIAIFLITITMTASAAFAQNENDALRYSQINPGGTARFNSMGGAFGALGGDFSTLSLNPAGLGLYRRSELTVSPAMGYNRVSTTYYGTTADDMRYNFNLQNVGVVFNLSTANPATEGGWRAVNLGFGMNRHNNYNQHWIAEGFNNQSSLMTDFLNQANQEGSVGNLDDYSTGLAWDTFLLFEEDGQFAVDMPGGNVLQRQETSSSGSVREFVMSIGANYQDRLYIGATVGIPSVFYEEESIFRETDVNGLSNVFNSLTYTNRFTTTGRGYNFKVGAILRLTDIIRVGGAIHTPTFYSLEDEYRASMRSDLNLDYDADFARSPIGRFSYELTTPMKAMGSLGLVFGNAGLVSLDYEYTDFTQMRLRSSTYMFSEENRVIENNFTAQHVVRLGGELRLDPILLRAGYGFYSSPYRTGVNDGSRSILSAGLGIRDRNYFLDFGYSLNLSQEDYYLYSAQFTQAASQEISMSRFMVTLGWRF
jgi:hypothetical protein